MDLYTHVHISTQIETIEIVILSITPPVFSHARNRYVEVGLRCKDSEWAVLTSQFYGSPGS